MGRSIPPPLLRRRIFAAVFAALGSACGNDIAFAIRTANAQYPLAEYRLLCSSRIGGGVLLSFDRMVDSSITYHDMNLHPIVFVDSSGNAKTFELTSILPQLENADTTSASIPQGRSTSDQAGALILHCTRTNGRATSLELYERMAGDSLARVHVVHLVGPPLELAFVSEYTLRFE